MLKEAIIWTILPRATSGPAAAERTLQLSVFVSPRLWLVDETGDRKLHQYPDFLDWPEKIRSAKFAVSFNDGTPIPATNVTPKEHRSDVWKALFQSNTRVKPYRFDSLMGAEIVSPSSGAIYDLIKGVYQQAATDSEYGGGTDLPPRHVLAGNDGLKEIAWPTHRPPQVQQVPHDPTPVKGTPWVPDTPEPTQPPKPLEKKPKHGCGCGCLALPLELLRRLLKQLGLIAMLPFTVGGFGGSAQLSGTGAAKTAFKDLYRAIEPPSDVAANMPKADELQEKYDFHEMVSTLGDYPNLLRYCGLVIDLELLIGDAAIPDTGTVRLEIVSLDTDAAAIHHRPRTHYDLGPARFLARPQPAGGDLRNGLLRVDDEDRFRVLALDIAGSGVKVQTTATMVISQEELSAWTPNEPEEQGLPALQTAGLSIARNGFGAHLRERIVASEALNNDVANADGSEKGDPSVPPRAELFAEDLVRGYRVDVWDDQSERWHSLCRRVGKYEFTAAALLLDEEEDEAFVQASAVEPVKASETCVLRTHESLFTWNGWSLGAPRYGNTILPDPGPETKIGVPPNAPATQFEMRVSFEPKRKSLPRLRFGYEYRLRMRAADLAGNSAFGPDDEAFQLPHDEVTRQVRYRRFEPVTPPMLMLQREPVEGESLERLVVRSTVTDAPAKLASQATARHVVPPKTSQMMAEHHRKFDGVPAMRSDDAMYARAMREAGSITHRVKADGTLEEIDGVKHIVVDDRHDYWLQTLPEHELTYLPDPYARGVLFMDLPGVAADAVIDGVNRITFTGHWPNPEPFRFVVHAIAANAAPAAPVWSAADRTLTVQVPQGETWPVRVSSFLFDKDLTQMAVWRWIEESGFAGLPALRNRALEGRNWLQMPFRTIVLVHAVQQPLIIPKLGAVTATRKEGDTLATLHGTCVVDAKSTEKIDIHAEWHDPIDDLTQSEFAFVKHEAHVDHVSAENPAVDALSLEGIQHAIGDTKHHVMTYRATASTRFREYFPRSIWEHPSNIARPLPSERDTPAAKVAEQGDVNVLSTARPDAPKLQYIVPFFRWTRTDTTTDRRDGGVRVYLDRPWYSSGKGELLGVTVDPAKDERLKKYASEWGMDPLWPAAATAPLTLGNFPDPVATHPAARLAEIENATVEVAGYEPAYDAKRGLWYCDIPIKSGSAYFPMLRLALVRFQPDSVDKMHISPVVLANFIQTVPRRKVTYDFSGLGASGNVHVEVEGPAYVGNQNDPETAPLMLLRLERPSSIGAVDELQWEPFASTLMKPALLPAEKMVAWSQDLNAGPTPPAKLRVVVLELERYAVDDDRQHVDALDLIGGGASLPGVNMGKDPVPFGYRVTFADAKEVP